MKRTTYIALLFSFFAILMTVQLSVTTQADDSTITVESVEEMCQNQIQFDLGLTTANARNINPDDCHENGDCTAICGSGYEPCTYMDCGSGTQLCHKN